MFSLKVPTSLFFFSKIYISSPWCDHIRGVLWKHSSFSFTSLTETFFFLPTTPSLEKPKLMFEAAAMCLNSHRPDTCNKKKLLKSETLDFVNMDVCPRYQVLTLEKTTKNCSNRRGKGELFLLSRGGFAAQMEQRGVGSVCLSSPHVFVRSLQKDTLRKTKNDVWVSGGMKWPLWTHTSECTCTWNQ